MNFEQEPDDTPKSRATGDEPGERESEAERPEHGPAISLILAALAIALPLYVLTLFWWYGNEPGWRYTGQGRGAGGGTSAGGPPMEILRTSDALGFGSAPPPKRAQSTGEFIRHLVCFARIHGSYAPTSLYLRARSFEWFDEASVETRVREEPAGGPPEFGFSLGGGAGNASGGAGASGTARLSLTFLKNLEAVLPHAPMLTRLAGPQEFMAGRDGAIRHPATIAAGDEYEMEFIPQRLFRAEMKIPSIDADSLYLQVDPLDSKRLRQIASAAIGELKGVATGQRVIALASHLEKTCTYSVSPSPVPRGTPVLEHFLAGDRRGHCQQIAASMVLLCRMQGVPARVAGGIVAGRESRSGLYQFSDASFHAWAEILTEQGWAICEIAASRERIDQNASPGCPLPTAEDLAAAVERARQENRRHGGGTFEGEGEQAAAQAEGRRQGKEPTRVTDKDWPGRKNIGGVRKPERVGAISGDPEKMRRAREEEQRREAERKRGQNRSWMRKFLLGLALLSLVVIVWKYNLLERLATAVLLGVAKLWKAMFGKKARDEAGERRQAIEEAEAFAERLRTVDAPTLEGTDVVKLFNRFVDVMGSLFEYTRPPAIETNSLGVATAGASTISSWASRQESETVAEYFTRIGERLRIDEDSRAFLVRTFSASLYGRKLIPPGEAQRFRDELRRLLQEAKERLESQAG